MVKNKKNKRPNTLNIKTNQSKVLPENTSQKGRVLPVINHTTFTGPLPHPEIFRQYGEIVPDAPERILRVFEDDSKHIRDMQTNALEAAKQDTKRVHWMAFFLIIIGFVFSGIFAWMDKNWLAVIVLGTTIGGIIAGYLQNRKTD